jgi:hypothetical protein
MWWHVACDALTSGRCLEIRYDGHSRIVEVHTVGTSSAGRPVMRGWQVTSTKPGGDGCWRLYQLDKTWNYGLTDKASEAPRRGHVRNDAHITNIRCQI